MKKTLLMTAVLMSASFLLHSADCILMTNDGREMKVDKIDMAKNGDFRYTDNGTTKSMKKGQVKWAWIPKTKEIRAADSLMRKGDLAAAAEAFEKVSKEAKILGWDVYCKYNQASALNKLGKTAEATEIFESLVDYKNVNPKNEKDLLAAYQDLIKNYIGTKKFDKALPIVNALTESADDDVACAAFMTKGDVWQAKADDSQSRDDLKNAALAYFQAALLFPKSKSNAAALLASYQAMSKAKDARAEKFAELLKKNHPDSPEAKQLK